jgi:hypothetical protein
MKLLKRSQLKPGVSYTPVDSGGEPLTGTLEMMSGIAQVNTVSVNAEGLQIEYAGETDVIWDSQTSVTRRGQRIWTDTAGNEIPENKVLFIEAT